MRYIYIYVLISPVNDYNKAIVHIHLRVLPLDCVEIKWHTVVCVIKDNQKYFSKTSFKVCCRELNMNCLHSLFRIFIILN